MEFSEVRTRLLGMASCSKVERAGARSSSSARKEEPEMRFHATAEVYPTIAGTDADRRTREVLGPHLQNIMGSGTLREAGLLSSKRGAFFLVNIDAP